MEDYIQFFTTQCLFVYLHLMKVLEEQYLGFFGMLNLNILIEVISMLMIAFLVLVNSILFMFFFIFNPTRLVVRPLACFCTSCFERDYQHCLNQSHVLEWKIIKLCTKDTQFVCANMEEDEEVGLEGS